MAKYVLLATWTDQGVKAAGESVQRSEKVRQFTEQLGGRMEFLLWTQGRYDLVGVVDMPSNEAFATLALQIASTGAVRTESLRAFTAEEFTGIVGNLG